MIATPVKTGLWFLPSIVPSCPIFLVSWPTVLRWTCWISQEFECHNLPLVVLGTFALWFPGRALCWWFGLVAPECKSIRLFVDGLVGPCWSWTIPSPLLVDAFLFPFLIFFVRFGWYGFNPGSTLTMKSGSDGALAAQVAMNTTLAAATGGITVFLLRDWAAVRHVEIKKLVNWVNHQTWSEMLVLQTWFYHAKWRFTRENWIWMCRNND